MGVSWEDREKFAHVMVVVPDGRIVCQRPKHVSFTKVWQATTFNTIPRIYSATPEAAISSAARVLWSTFRLRVPQGSYTHLMSHYVEQMGKRLELVMCKMQSRGQLLVPKHLEIVILTFEGLIREIDEDRGAFAPHTLHAINVLDTMVWG